MKHNKNQNLDEKSENTGSFSKSVIDSLIALLSAFDGSNFCYAPPSNFKTSVDLEKIRRDLREGPQKDYLNFHLDMRAAMRNIDAR